MARPKKKIDPKLIENMARIHCTYEEMASIVDCSTWTLKRRFAQIIEKARSEGKMSLRRAQWKAAIDEGDSNLLKWLGIHHLGQNPKQYEIVQNNVTISQTENIQIEQQKQLENDILEVQNLINTKLALNGPK